MIHKAWITPIILNGTFTYYIWMAEVSEVMVSNLQHPMSILCEPALQNRTLGTVKWDPFFCKAIKTGITLSIVDAKNNSHMSWTKQAEQNPGHGRMRLYFQGYRSRNNLIGNVYMFWNWSLIKQQLMLHVAVVHFQNITETREARILFFLII